MSNTFKDSDRRMIVKGFADQAAGFKAVQAELARLQAFIDGLEKTQVAQSDRLAAVIGELAVTLEEIRVALLESDKPDVPGPFGEITLISERMLDMKRLQTYHAVFPTVPEGVAKQELQVFSGETQVSSGEFGAEVTAADLEVPGGPGAPDVTLQMTHFDSEGDEGPAKSQTFTPSGTIAPNAPGDFGAIDLESERTVDDDEPVRPPVAH